MKTEYQIAFGKRIRLLRLEREMTQEQLGARSGLHPNYICSIEKGNRNVGINSVCKLAEALGVSPAKLFEASSL